MTYKEYSLNFSNNFNISDFDAEAFVKCDDNFDVSDFDERRIFQEAKKLQRNADPNAHYYFLASGKLGNPNGFYEMGLICLYSNDHSIPNSKNKAANFFKIAADMGHVRSMVLYAFLVRDGIGIEADLKESMYYFNLASGHFDLTSIINYSSMLLNGNGLKKDESQAFAYAKLAADLNSIHGIHNVGVMLYDGTGAPQNKYQAATYFKKAADMGYIDSMYNYALMSYNGDGIPQNFEEAVKYFRMASYKYHQPSMLLYIKMFSENTNTEQDTCEVERFKTYLMENGNTEIYSYLQKLVESNDLLR